jgi:WhiB family transcriptional regulator, redox-sensing transcriptional regulator
MNEVFEVPEEPINSPEERDAAYQAFLDNEAASAQQDFKRSTSQKGRVAIQSFDHNSDPWGDWREKAACKGLETDFFFPIGIGVVAAEQADKAKKVCDGCEVKKPCLIFAKTTNQEAGILGGETEEERKPPPKKRVPKASVETKEAS